LDSVVDRKLLSNSSKPALAELTDSWTWSKKGLTDRLPPNKEISSGTFKSSASENSSDAGIWTKENSLLV